METGPQHIVIICSRLDLPGGTERAICNMANLFAGKGHTVTILVLDITPHSYYFLDERIQVIFKNLHFGITPGGNLFTSKYAFIKHIFELKELIRKTGSDLVISTDYPFSIGLVLGGVKKYAKLVSWEPHHFYWLKKSKFWNFLFRKAYPRLDAVVCLNAREKTLFDNLGCNTSVIPSFIPDFPVAGASLDSKVLLTVGWFIRRKGIDLIPEIAKTVFRKHPDWKWMLVGKGEESATLLNALHVRNIAEHLIIVPPVPHNELEKIYADASLYVLPSRSEALPTVLIESMAHGVPCIAFDCATGPSDIITDMEDGILVARENAAKMAEAICALIEDDDLRKTMGRKAAQNIQRFSGDAVYGLWCNMFNEI